MEMLLPALIGLAGVVLGGVLQQRALARSVRDADLAAHRQLVRDTIVRLAYALSTHRGHLYTRWDLAHSPTATPEQAAQAQETSHASRGEITCALYQLRALTQDSVLLAAADAAVAVTYAVKTKGEDLATVTEPELAARRQRAIDADDALLAATTTRLTP
ncbi:hypothetical protein ACH4GK_37555 [Streptomyces rimosus]|uniref:hypothetical protein n=1 Tax=Streptomyces rimosus TaxID=1927 RepID=UPI0004C7462B|nr:hypothetical protein [Streptomyces rimosus]